MTMGRCIAGRRRGVWVIWIDEEGKHSGLTAAILTETAAMRRTRSLQGNGDHHERHYAKRNNHGYNHNFSRHQVFNFKNAPPSRPA